jgi:hypothetical protein
MLCVVRYVTLCQRSPTERGVSECDHEDSTMERPTGGIVKKSSCLLSTSNPLKFLISFLKFQFSSHQPISVADFGEMLNHVKCLVPYLQDTLLCYFDLCKWLQAESPSLGRAHEEMHLL